MDSKKFALHVILPLSVYTIAGAVIAIFGKGQPFSTIAGLTVLLLIFYFLQTALYRRSTVTNKNEAWTSFAARYGVPPMAVLMFSAQCLFVISDEWYQFCSDINTCSLLHGPNRIQWETLAAGLIAWIGVVQTLKFQSKLEEVREWERWIPKGGDLLGVLIAIQFGLRALKDTYSKDSNEPDESSSAKFYLESLSSLYPETVEHFGISGQLMMIKMILRQLSRYNSKLRRYKTRYQKVLKAAEDKEISIPKEEDDEYKANVAAVNRSLIELLDSIEELLDEVVDKVLRSTSKKELAIIMSRVAKFTDNYSNELSEIVKASSQSHKEIRDKLKK